MAKDNDKDGAKAPIIIKKIKKGGGHGHHGGAWKVAFADFVTAMMALFMVLWLVGQSPKTKSAVGAYFRDPLGLAGGGNTEFNSGPRSGGAGFFQGGNTAIAVDTEFSGAKSGSSNSPKRADMAELSHARDRLAQALLALRGESWARNVEMTASEDGLRIEIQDSDGLRLFDAGSAKVHASAKPTLKAIADELRRLPNLLVIEGHTNAEKRGRVNDDNWLLSVARADAARAVLQSEGIRASQISEIRGYADKRPRLWNDPEHPRNRRITVLVQFQREGAETTPATSPAADPLLQSLDKLDAREGGSRTVELTPGGDAWNGAPLNPLGLEPQTSARTATTAQQHGVPAGAAGPASSAEHGAPAPAAAAGEPSNAAPSTAQATSVAQHNPPQEPAEASNGSNGGVSAATQPADARDAQPEARGAGESPASPVPAQH